MMVVTAVRWSGHSFPVKVMAFQNHIMDIQRCLTISKYLHLLHSEAAFLLHQLN